MLWAWMVDAARAAKVSLETLYKEHAPVLLRQAHRLCGGGVDAEDVLQDVFLVADRRLDQIDPDQNPGGYLFGILRNVIREHRRRRARQMARDGQVPPLGGAPPLPDEGVEQSERRERLARCLATLPERQREAIALVDLEQLSPKEAAALMGKSEGAVHTLLSRGRRALSAAWTAAEDVSEGAAA